MSDHIYCVKCKNISWNTTYCPTCDYEEYMDAIAKICEEEDEKKRIEQERIAAEVAEDIEALDLTKYRIINLLQHVQNGYVSCSKAAGLILDEIYLKFPEA